MSFPHDKVEPHQLAVAHFKLALEALNVNTESDGLRGTPLRWCKSLTEMMRGYAEDPAEILSTNFHGDGYDQLVLLKDITFSSLCEHHLLPFVGKAHVGYVPTERVVGLSKLARLVECFARRLQIQERMTKQIADALAETLKPRALGVMVEATHSCMALRGITKPGAVMVTSDLRGLFRNEEPGSAAARAEFFSLIDGGNR